MLLTRGLALTSRLRLHPQALHMGPSGPQRTCGVSRSSLSQPGLLHSWLPQSCFLLWRRCGVEGCCWGGCSWKRGMGRGGT